MRRLPDFENQPDWKRDKDEYDKKKRQEEVERRKQLPDGGRVGDFMRGVVIRVLILVGILLFAMFLTWTRTL